MRILKKGDFVSVSMKAESMIKVLWSNMYISEWPTKMDGDRGGGGSSDYYVQPQP